MNSTKILIQLETVLEEHNVEVDSIVLRKGKEVMNSIVLDSIVSLWFYEGRDYMVRYKGKQVLSTSSLTLAFDTVVKLYKYYQSIK